MEVDTDTVCGHFKEVFGNKFALLKSLSAQSSKTLIKE